MTRWKKDETEFKVSITANKQSNTSYSYIPKPILEQLGDPTSLKFLMTKGKIVVQSGDE